MDKTKQLEIPKDNKEPIIPIEIMNQKTVQELLDSFHVSIDPFMKVMTQYQCAAIEVETKFKVLNMSMAIDGEKNPIESIKTRIKNPDSIIRKLLRQGYPVNLESIQEYIYDVAGVRVVCSFIDDIYRVEELFLRQDDIKLIRRKDYIENPKDSGYRSLHLVVETPIFTDDGKKDIKVEVQMRTIAMDFWASLEHKLRYKKDLDKDTLERLGSELEECATYSSLLDQKMQAIRDELLSLQDKSKLM